MSGAAATARPLSLDVTSTTPVPFLTLAGVELRKAFDTRAGRWYAFSILGISFLVMLAQALLFSPGNQDYQDVAGIQGGVLGFFVPVLPILLVTSEWSQRTGLVTFALEPRRARVVAAKAAASLVIAVGVMTLALAIGGLGVFLADLRGVDPSYSLSGTVLRNFVLLTLIGVFLAFAYAMLIMNSPAAIVAYFFYALPLPIVVGILSITVGWFEDLAPWIEFNTAQTPLFTGDFEATAREWAQFATSGTIWFVIPLVLGVVRLLRAEVK